MRKLNVHLLYEHDHVGHPHGSAFIRLILPLGQLVSDDAIQISAGVAMPNRHIDVVIVDRLWRGWGDLFAVQNLLAEIKRKGIKLIYTLDDDLYDIDFAVGHKKYPSEVIRIFTSAANGLVVSTENLKSKTLQYSKNVTVIQNVIDTNLFFGNKVREDGACIKIGYMGTYTHLDDLRMIQWPMRKLLQSNKKKIRFEVVGIGSSETINHMFSGCNVQAIQPPGRTLYPDFMRWLSHTVCWDIAIAPLRATGFNSYKSDIKWLDYTALGAAGVYSNVDAYKSNLAHGEKGILVGDSSVEWLTALDALIHDEKMRENIVSNSVEKILQERNLSIAASQWKKVIFNVLDV